MRHIANYHLHVASEPLAIIAVERKHRRTHVKPFGVSFDLGFRPVQVENQCVTLNCIGALCQFVYNQLSSLFNDYYAKVTRGKTFVLLFFVKCGQYLLILHVMHFVKQQVVMQIELTVFSNA